MKLSTAQVRTLENVAGASDRHSPYVAPRGPGSRPAKFLKTSGLVTENGLGFWVTELGRQELASFKGTPP